MTLGYIAHYLFLPLLLAGACLGLLQWVAAQYPLFLKPAIVKFITVVTVVICVIFILFFFFGGGTHVADINVGHP